MISEKTRRLSTAARAMRKTSMAFLSGALRELCLVCNHGMGRESALRKLRETYPDTAIEGAIRFLEEYGYLVEIEDRFLALPTLGEDERK